MGATVTVVQGAFEGLIPWVSVLRWAESYGYAFLFVASVAENVVLVGILVPGDAAVVLGGGLAAQAYLEPSVVVVVVVVGTILGSLISFFAGRRGGLLLLERWGARFGVDRAKIRAVEGFFGKHGAKTVFAASFVSGVKNLVPAVAGASRMPVGHFVLYNAAGSALRGAALTTVGYAFGANLPRALALVSSANGYFLLAAAFVAVVLVLRYVKRRPSRRTSACRQK